MRLRAIAGVALALLLAGPAAAAPQRVLYIGDSLGVGTTPGLARELGSAATVRGDSRIGRPSPEGLRVLRGMVSPSDQIVVFDLGTNDDPGQPRVLAGDLAAAHAATGDRCLIVATLNRPPLNGVPVDGLNQAVLAFASATRSVQLVDWNAIVASEPSLLGPDHVHPTPAGYAVRAQLFAEAVGQCSAQPAASDDLTATPAPTPRKRPPGHRPAPQIKVPGIESSGISFTEPLEVRGRPAQLLLPNTKPPYPAVVMLGGGQGQAEFLAAHGIAALTYQERGSLADAQAALAALRARSDIRRDGVGVWALGEAANEAAQLRGAAAIVAMSPVVVPRADARDWRVRRALDAKATPVTNWLRLRARGDQADPARAWRQVAQPVLAIWGTEDDQVPIRASAEALRGALEAAPNKDRTFRWFVTGHAGTAPGLLEETARWLGLHLGAKRARPLVRASLPPTNGRPDPVDVTNASALYSAPIQIAWLLLPALLLGFAARTRVAIAPAIAALACTAAIAGGIAMALHSDGRIATVVGTPWPFALAFAFAGALAAVTIAYVGRRAFVPAVASAVWLALALFWLL